MPGPRRAHDDLIRVEFVDRSLVIAAQSLFAMVPLLVVMAAFTPEGLRDTALDQLGDLMAVQDTALVPVRNMVSAEPVRTQTGLVGVVVVFSLATSYARALQRPYERIWDLPHCGGFPGTRPRPDRLMSAWVPKGTHHPFRVSANPVPGTRLDP